MTQAELIIEKFGGMIFLARALGHKWPTTVQGWKENGCIPMQYHERIFEAARELAIEISPQDFLADGLRAAAEALSPAPSTDTPS